MKIVTNGFNEKLDNELFKIRPTRFNIFETRYVAVNSGNFIGKVCSQGRQRCIQCCKEMTIKSRRLCNVGEHVHMKQQ